MKTVVIFIMEVVKAKHFPRLYYSVYDLPAYLTPPAFSPLFSAPLCPSPLAP